MSNVVGGDGWHNFYRRRWQSAVIVIVRVGITGILVIEHAEVVKARASICPPYQELTRSGGDVSCHEQNRKKEN